MKYELCDLNFKVEFDDVLLTIDVRVSNADNQTVYRNVFTFSPPNNGG